MTELTTHPQMIVTAMICPASYVRSAQIEKTARLATTRQLLHRKAQERSLKLIHTEFLREANHERASHFAHSPSLK